MLNASHRTIALKGARSQEEPPPLAVVVIVVIGRRHPGICMMAKQTEPLGLYLASRRPVCQGIRLFRTKCGGRAGASDWPPRAREQYQEIAGHLAGALGAIQLGLASRARRLAAWMRLTFLRPPRCRRSAAQWPQAAVSRAIIARSVSVGSACARTSRIPVGPGDASLTASGVSSEVHTVAGMRDYSASRIKAAREISGGYGAQSGRRFWCGSRCRCAGGLGRAKPLPDSGAER
jgi:hypothetical protein